MIRSLVCLREQLAGELATLPAVRMVYPSDANFLLVRVGDAQAVYAALLRDGIVVRDRSKVELCEGCLRITVGTEKENQVLMEALRAYKEKN
jgi:histidinol-phosphate aminotransferase